MSTASQSWQTLPDLAVDVGCPRSALAAVAVSLAFERGSAPVQIRLRSVPITTQGVDPVTAVPGVVPLTPRGADTRSFTFSPRMGGDGHGRFVYVEWRSRTGNRSAVWARSMHVTYEGPAGTCA